MTEGNYSNVGHREPVYKGLGAMNPCDLSNILYTDTENFIVRRHFYCNYDPNISVRWADTNIVLFQLALPSVDVDDG
jgi:hypothetical protein